MSSEIPRDFGKEWDLSDVVIRTMNSKDQVLHASKTMLAMHSPYFKAMFFGADWKEKGSKFLELQEDYEVVLDVLKILHQTDREFDRDNITYNDPDYIYQLYLFADKCDIPLVRRMCEEELAAQITPDSLDIAVKLGLHKVKSELLKNLDYASIDEFLEESGDELQFTKSDVKVINQKWRAGSKTASGEDYLHCASCDIKYSPKSAPTQQTYNVNRYENSPYCRVCHKTDLIMYFYFLLLYACAITLYLDKGLPDDRLTYEINMDSETSPDFTQEWDLSDVVIRTMNSNDQVLHASKTMLALHSPYFKAMYFGADWKEKDSKFLELQEDYEMVLDVLKILHQIDRKFTKLSNYHTPDYIYQLYLFADKCDIPLIRRMCEEELTAQVTPESLEVAVKLGLNEVKSELLKELDYATIEKLLESSGDELQFSRSDVKVINEKSKAANKAASLEQHLQCQKCNNQGRRYCVNCHEYF